ncbi:glycosyltransferase family 4 protein [Elusimicrobiota bacterium]
MSKKKKDKLRIAQLHWGFPPTIGGVETHLSVMLPEFVRLGHKTFLLTGSFDGESAKSNYKGVEVIRSPLMDLNWLYHRGLEKLDDSISKEYEEFLGHANPDIVHVHNMHYFSKPHAVILQEICSRRGVPLVLTAHNSWDDILFVDVTTHIKWTRTIAVSHFIKKELVGTGFDDQNITVVHHGIDLDIFKPNSKLGPTYEKHPQLKGRKVIFHPARMGMGKGCDISIKAMRMIKEQFPDALLVLAGTKNIIDWGATQQREIAYFVDLVKLFHLQNHCYINSFSLEEMPGLYNAADVIIYPSSAPEPFGLAMLESMATAKPIIVTKVGGMPEVIQDRINGHVIPRRDFDVLASRTIELLGNPRLRKRFGTTGRQIAQSQYTKEIMTKNTLAVYQQVLG